MKKIIKTLLLLLIFSHNLASFNKVIIWGHKLHSHTHSYIHNAFYRTFKHLGYDTYWFDNKDDVQRFDFSNSLFITESQVDANIPLREDCNYILHNCDQAKYKKLIDQGKCCTLQVYIDDVATRNVTKLDDCIYYDLAGKIIYMPWATDLLPDEIDAMKQKIARIKKEKRVYWIGTLGDGKYGNSSEVRPFQRACKKERVSFNHKRAVSVEENINYIQRSYMAPTLVGAWQKEVGYIPCRIFKNISYGQMGITNSKTVWELFKRKIVYNPDTYQLFFDAKKRLGSMKIDEVYELMDLVKTKHTYINRIENLLFFSNLVEQTYGQK